jgi:hypothetical protein
MDAIYPPSRLEGGNENLITRDYRIETDLAEEWIETRILSAGRLYFGKDDFLNGFGAKSCSFWREGFPWGCPRGKKNLCRLPSLIRKLPLPLQTVS